MRDSASRAFLMGLSLPGQPGFVVEGYLDELAELARSTGMEVVGRSLQNRRARRTRARSLAGAKPVIFSDVPLGPRPRLGNEGNPRDRRRARDDGLLLRGDLDFIDLKHFPTTKGRRLYPLAFEETRNCTGFCRRNQAFPTGPPSAESGVGTQPCAGD